MKKRLWSLILGLAMTMSAGTFVQAEEDGVTQTVLYSIIADSKPAFCGQTLNSFGASSEGMTTDMSYTGTSSFRFTDVRSVMRYTAWNKDASGNLISVADINQNVKDAVTAGTAYVAGWFYAEKAEQVMTVELISEGADRSGIVILPTEQWTYVSAPIKNTVAGRLVNGVISTGAAGNIYVDDLCIVSTSDGSAPTAPARPSEAAPGAEPNRYMKVLRTIYDEGMVNGWTNGANAVTVDLKNTERAKTGEYALKATGTLLLGYTDDNRQVATLGAINDEITNAVKAGKAYWTAWIYIDKETTDVRGESLDFYMPTNMRTRGEWKWVCMKLEEKHLTQNNMFIKTLGVYSWFDDVKIVTFEELPAGLNFAEYNVAGAEEDNTVAAGTLLTVSGSLYNNTVKGTNVSVLFAEFDSFGKLQDVVVEPAGKAVPFRDFEFSETYAVSGNAGNTVKVLLWDVENSISPLSAVKQYVID